MPPDDMMLSLPARGLTPKEVARMLRVIPDKIRSWIKSGELKATNTAAALCARPRWVILPDALAEFTRRRSSVPPPKSARIRKKRTDFVDFYPDVRCKTRRALQRERGESKGN